MSKILNYRTYKESEEGKMKMMNLPEGYEYFEDAGKFGIRKVDTKEVIVPAKYDYIADFSLETAIVRINGREMTLDKNGNILR